MSTYRIVGVPMDGTLVDEHGVAFRPFSVYIGCLRRQGYAVNTINAYGQHVARFLNYVNQAVDVYSGELNINGWRDIIGSYGDYLLYGVEANDFIARQIAQKNQRWRKTGIRSMGVIETAIVKYIELGELEQFNETDSYIHPMFPREYKNLLGLSLPREKNEAFLAD